MIEHLIQKIKIRQAEIEKSLALGVPYSWEAYQKMVGEYIGVQSVLDMIEKMLSDEDNKEL